MSSWDPPPQRPDLEPTGYGPSEADVPRERPGAVTAVVVISYVQAVLALIAALGFLVLGMSAGADGQTRFVLVLEAVLVAIIGVLIGVMGNRLGRRSRGWRTAYLVLTGIGVVLGVVGLGRQPTSLLGIAVGILCIVLLLLPRSRAWFSSAP